MQFIVLFISAALLVATPAWAGPPYTKDQQFSTVMPDLPLMQGMEELPPEKDPKDPSKLKNPNETKAVVGGIHRQAVTYYQQEFWSQGWKNKNPGTPNVFVKDGETITMTTEFSDGKTTVTFTREKEGAEQNKTGAQNNAAGSRKGK